MICLLIGKILLVNINGVNEAKSVKLENTSQEPDIYSWQQSNMERTYLWRSFPRLALDSQVPYNNGNNLVVSEVLGNWNPVPDGLHVWYNNQNDVYGDYDDEEESWTWDQANYTMNSKNGYKMSRENGKWCVLYSRGLKCLDNVELHTEPYQETWLGYFLQVPQNVLDAFPQEVLEDAIAIYTMEWAISRTSTHDPWSGSPEYCKLNYMDCVVIKTINESNNFYWQISTRNEEPEYRPVAEHFTFNDDIDYLPVYTVFDENDIPDEVAIYVNDECRGAQVVEDTLCQICAHILEEELGQDIEFAFWYEGGSREERKSEYLVENTDTGVYESGSLVTGTPGIHYKVSFKDKQDDSIPAAIELQCYPNPFNPELTISFNLQEQKEVKLDIFNIKGQRIRELKIENVKCKVNSVVWDGNNDSGNQVSSGVYFIRLAIGDKIITSKAVLMK